MKRLLELFRNFGGGGTPQLGRSKDAKRHRCKANINNKLEICHPELVSGSQEKQKTRCQSDIQHDKNNNPCLQSLPRGREVKKNSLHSSLKRKAAFTLAEVLVTLGIIGVVSAMTLPTLISNHRNKVLEAQFKKEYSFIMQTVDTFLQRTSCAEAFCIKSDNFIKEFEKFTKFVHKCTPTSIDEKLCFTRINDCSYTDLQRKLDCVRVQVLDDYQYVLPDGALITFNNTTIGVDVNGKTKRPNAIGQDVFLFELKAENFSVKLVPWGAEGTPSQECQITGRTSAYNGEGCAYRALTEADYFKKLP